MRVRDTMSTPAYCVRPDDAAQHAAAEMIGRGLAQLPVVDERGRLQGVVDTAALGNGARTVGEAMGPEILRLSPSMDAQEAARRLLVAGATCAPVCDHERVVGIVNVHDVLRALGPAANKVLARSPQGPIAPREHWEK